MLFVWKVSNFYMQLTRSLLKILKGWTWQSFKLAPSIKLQSETARATFWLLSVRVLYLDHSPWVPHSCVWNGCTSHWAEIALCERRWPEVLAVCRHLLLTVSPGCTGLLQPHLCCLDEKEDWCTVYTLRLLLAVWVCLDTSNVAQQFHSTKPEESQILIVWHFRMIMAVYRWPDPEQLFIWH